MERLKEAGAVGFVVVVMCAVGVLGCLGASPQVKKTSVNKPAGEVFNCAQAALLKLGYTPQDGNKDVGFVRGVKQISGDATLLLSGARFEDVITVAVVSEGAGTSLQVTGTTRQENVVGYSPLTGAQPMGANVQTPTSDTAKADVEEIQRLCGGASPSPTTAPKAAPKTTPDDDDDEAEERSDRDIF